jgi:hypothetical protein
VYDVCRSQVCLHFWDVSHALLDASPSVHTLLCTKVAAIFYVLDVSSKERCVRHPKV